MEASVTEALDDLLGVLAGGAFTVLTASLIGRTALARLRPLRGMMTEAEGWILSYAIGSALLSSAMFALCAAGWVTDASVVLLGAAATACWLRWGRWTWPPKQGRRRSPDWPLLLAVILPASIYGVLYIVHTLAPETRSDAMGYHLGLVQRYYRASGFVPLTTNVYAQISQGAEMLYLFAYAIGRESAAKIVHFSFLVATVGAILCFARRVRCDLAGVFAAVVYFTCPVVIPAATSAYNDCALAFSLWMVFYVLVLWWRDPRLEWLALMGLVIGYAFAIKYTGVVSVAGGVAAAAAVLLRERDWRPALKCLAVAGGAAAAVGVPWLVKSAVYTGNPLAPFFNDVFRNPYVSVEWESAYRFAMQSYQYGPFDRMEQFLGAPFELVFGERYAGSVGWMLLLLPAALLALRRPLGRALLGAAVVCALPWLLNAGARFLIPSVIFGAFALGLSLPVSTEEGSAPRCRSCVGSAVPHLLAGAAGIVVLPRPMDRRGFPLASGPPTGTAEVAPGPQCGVLPAGRPAGPDHRQRDPRLEFLQSARGVLPGGAAGLLPGTREPGSRGRSPGLRGLCKPSRPRLEGCLVGAAIAGRQDPAGTAGWRGSLDRVRTAAAARTEA